MESCTCHNCNGAPPPPTHTQGWPGDDNVMDGWGARPLRWLCRTATTHCHFAACCSTVKGLVWAGGGVTIGNLAFGDVGRKKTSFGQFVDSGARGSDRLIWSWSETIYSLRQASTTTRAAILLIYLPQTHETGTHRNCNQKYVSDKTGKTLVMLRVNSAQQMSIWWSTHCLKYSEPPLECPTVVCVWCAPTKNMSTQTKDRVHWTQNENTKPKMQCFCNL